MTTAAAQRAEGRAVGGVSASTHLSTQLEAHKAVVRRFVEEVRNRGNLAVIPELVAPSQAAAFESQAQALLAAFGDYRVEIEELVAEGDTVVLRAGQVGTHRSAYLGVLPTGRRVRWHVVRFFRFRDGRIADTWVLADERALVAQLTGQGPG
jgi:predicted ester cyclase